MDLSVSGKAASNRMSNVVFWMSGGKLRYEFRTFGPGPHKAHVAPENIPKLREFIETIAAQPCPQRSAPWIVLERPDGAKSTFGVLSHRAEFEDLELLTEEADPDLAIQDGAAIQEPYSRSHCHQQRRNYRKGGCRTGDIENAFDETRRPFNRLVGLAGLGRWICLPSFRG